MNAFQDLDTYTIPGLASLPLQMVLVRAVDRSGVGHAIAINRALIGRNKAFGADPQCSDMARLGRVVHTVNGKSGHLILGR
jgi:hypothetical protein